MKVWLDDLRPIKEGFDVWVKTAPEAIKLLETGTVTLISLDHDLGEEEGCGTGYDVARFLEKQAFLRTLGKVEWRIHSANPVGIKNMTAALEKADEFWEEHEMLLSAMNMSQEVFDREWNTPEEDEAWKDL